MAGFGSLQNMIAGNTNPGSIGVGDQGAEIFWTDRYPAVVVAKPSASKILVQRMKCKFDTSGYEVEGTRTTESESVIEYSLRKNGTWVRVGSPMNDGVKFVRGATGYYDRSF